MKNICNPIISWRKETWTISKYNFVYSIISWAKKGPYGINKSNAGEICLNLHVQEMCECMLMEYFMLVQMRDKISYYFRHCFMSLVRT